MSERGLARSSGFELQDAALEAVVDWRFIPARGGGVAVPCEADVPLVIVLRR